ncbi:MAG: 4Fe-4S dicluster domain-containing protein [Candidatus Latescibacteria bacterium]|nr:4Fe-4S dicluster domain-containing protein [Candidatus Latescibacterota bacterium]NIO55237.1 4Fe-4S dicluster domain-containing protein [Candidatus Latescibacterota bacterium]
MDESRRDFLKKFGFALLSVGGGFPLLRTIASASEKELRTGAAVSTQWGMVIDIQKCLSEQVRRACIEACNREHNVPEIPDPEEEVKWIWSETYEDAFPEGIHPYTADYLKGKPVLVLCNHCTNPPCVKVCPTQATWKREEDGIVMMDMHRCIGCRYCIAGCPYGARSFNWRDPRPYIKGDLTPFPTRAKGVVEKCNFCAERLRKGQEPACVAAVKNIPGMEGALTFGDLYDPNSEVSRVLRENHTICRKVSLGTGPNVFYIV